MHQIRLAKLTVFLWCHWLSNVQKYTIHLSKHDDVIKWKHFPRHWPFVQGIYRSPVNSPHKGQWRGALMFYLICVWRKDWINNRDAGDLKHHRAQYDVTVMDLIEPRVVTYCTHHHKIIFCKIHGIINTDFITSCLKIYQGYPGRIGSIRYMLILLIIRIITEHYADQIASEFVLSIFLRGCDGDNEHWWDCHPDTSRSHQGPVSI